MRRVTVTATKPISYEIQHKRFTVLEIDMPNCFFVKISKLMKSSFIFSVISLAWSIYEEK